MLSRVAESLYWTSRYIERVENTARAISVNSELTLDLPAQVGHWSPLIEAMGDRNLFGSCYEEVNGDNVVRFLTFDARNPNSIQCGIQAARSNANSVRDFITLEMWEQLNGLYLKMREATASRDVSQELLRDVARSCQLIRGTADAAMSHDEGWHFVRLGRMIERADQTSRMLDTRYLFSIDETSVVGPYGDILWAALLRSTSALQMYRKRHHRIVPQRLVAFLVLDREFPRSVRHCVAEAEEAVRAISETPDSSFQNRAGQVLGRLRAYLDYMHVDEIMALGVHEFIDLLQIRLNEANASVLETFCAVPAHPPAATAVAGIEGWTSEG